MVRAPPVYLGLHKMLFLIHQMFGEELPVMFSAKFNWKKFQSAIFTIIGNNTEINKCNYLRILRFKFSFNDSSLRKRGMSSPFFNWYLKLEGKKGKFYLGGIWTQNTKSRKNVAEHFVQCAKYFASSPYSCAQNWHKYSVIVHRLKDYHSVSKK